MDEKQLIELNRYCSPYSLLFIDNSGSLRRLICPFKAQALTELEFIRKGEVVDVEQVLISRDVLLIYLIQGMGYHYANFKIINQS